MASKLDHVYSSVIHSLSTEAYFRKGWGDVSSLDPHRFALLLNHLQMTPLQVSWKAVETGVQRGCAYEVLEGQFTSPCTPAWVPGLPEASQTGRLWLMRPTDASTEFGPHGMKACFLQLPATGEHLPKCETLRPVLLFPH